MVRPAGDYERELLLPTPAGAPCLSGNWPGETILSVLLIFEETMAGKSRKFGKSTDFMQKNHRKEYSLHATSKDTNLQVES